MGLNQLNIQQQLSHLSQVFGVGYMNQKELRRIGHMDQLSPLIPIEQYAFTKIFSLYILSYYPHPCLKYKCKIINTTQKADGDTIFLRENPN